ncbi:hypothetical protein SpCBS45565_g06395 [Spizellomyces sp. 'palustris']|nr:hypothetical protein SpCBS45565_g06395 [Spizellomyces sp. 'palustris']
MDMHSSSSSPTFPTPTRRQMGVLRIETDGQRSGRQTLSPIEQISSALVMDDTDRRDPLDFLDTLQSYLVYRVHPVARSQKPTTESALLVKTWIDSLSSTDHHHYHNHTSPTWSNRTSGSSTSSPTQPSNLLDLLDAKIAELTADIDTYHIPRSASVSSSLSSHSSCSSSSSRLESIPEHPQHEIQKLGRELDRLNRRDGRKPVLA